MDRTKTTDSKALRRIVVVLLALADLAERAGGRSFAVRTLVLWLLRSAEVLARNHLAVLTPAVQSDPVPLTDDSATEAIRLATSFRKLAAILTALAADIPAPSSQTRMARFAAVVPAGLPAALGAPTSAVKRRDSS